MEFEEWETIRRSTVNYSLQLRINFLKDVNKVFRFQTMKLRRYNQNFKFRFLVTVFPNGANKETEGWLVVLRDVKIPKHEPRPRDYGILSHTVSVIDVEGNSRLPRSFVKIPSAEEADRFPKYLERSSILDRKDEFLTGGILTVRCDIHFYIKTIFSEGLIHRILKDFLCSVPQEFFYKDEDQARNSNDIPKRDSKDEDQARNSNDISKREKKNEDQARNSNDISKRHPKNEDQARNSNDISKRDPKDEDDPRDSNDISKRDTRNHQAGNSYDIPKKNSKDEDHSGNSNISKIDPRDEDQSGKPNGISKIDPSDEDQSGKPNSISIRDLRGEDDPRDSNISKRYQKDEDHSGKPNNISKRVPRGGDKEGDSNDISKIDPRDEDESEDSNDISKRYLRDENQSGKPNDISKRIPRDENKPGDSNEISKRDPREAFTIFDFTRQILTLPPSHKSRRRFGVNGISPSASPFNSDSEEDIADILDHVWIFDTETVRFLLSLDDRQDSVGSRLLKASPVLRCMVNTPMKERTHKHVYFPDISSRAFIIVLFFLEKGTLPTSPNRDFLCVYKFSHLHEMEKLQRKCADQMAKSVEFSTEELKRIADDYSDEYLSERLVNRWNEFDDSYQPTSRVYERLNSDSYI